MTLDSGVALISLAEAKTYLNNPSDREDLVIQSLLNSVSSWIQAYLDRSLVKATGTEYYDGSGQDTLVLLRTPVVSITSIHVDSLRTFGSDSLVDPTNYFFQKKSGIVKSFNLYSAWSSGQANIKVVYSAGYDTTKSTEADGGVPHAIRLAVARLLDLHYRSGYSQRHLDVKSESIGDRNTTFGGGEFPSDVKQMLDPFRQLITPPGYSHAD